jgi:hypothetical protein
VIVNVELVERKEARNGRLCIDIPFDIGTRANGDSDGDGDKTRRQTEVSISISEISAGFLSTEEDGVTVGGSPFRCPQRRSTWEEIFWQ